MRSSCGVVQRGELRPLVGRRREHEVGARDHLVLDARAVLGVVVDAGFGLHAGQRVERRDQREVELVLQAVRDRTREPVVAVEHVDRFALAASAASTASTNGSTSVGQLVLRDRRRGPASTCSDPEARLDLHDRRLRRGARRACRRRTRRRRGRARSRAPGRTRSCRRRRRCPAARAATCASRTRRSGGRTSARIVANAAAGPGPRVGGRPRRAAPVSRLRRRGRRSRPGTTGRSRPAPASGDR